ncbi:1-acyl-sn-glycerol-3-phosphate acyltransferase [Rhodocaloribacter litoris]|uniref:lysophospholipid acyltransferase family protein n=1 Tax=Rhodocaloribacter litoris TaxID=2558931 RepID=UPI0014228C01|nr:lysophospholipid acyltransferase family protein [Rhodocaloribacter litoris]QXD15654.1 1-acyl-sn-glycerol-3-phosphate acyltransferase [Rhodocaloribacter litoris]
MTTLRSLWVWSSNVLLILLWLPLLALIRLFDRDPARYTTGRWFRRLGAAMTRVNPFWRVEVSGERIEDPRRPYVVVCNHQSNVDIPVISRLPWDMKWVAKAELFRVPVVGWMMRLAGDIPVERGEQMSRARVLVAARRVLENRCSVMFFPEGTRSRDGRVYAFNDGAFRLAIKAGVPVLPLVLDGSFNALPKDSWRFGEPSTIRLRVLPPVETAGLRSGDTAALRDRVRGQIVAQVAAWRGVPVEAVDALATVTDV